MSSQMVSSKYWSDLVQLLEPYVPGEQPNVVGLIKLNTNENPYPPSPAVAAVLTQGALDSLRLYPDPNSMALKAAVARVHGVSESNVFVGNGSDEVLALAFMAFFKQSQPVLFPDISYSFYPVYCNLYEIDSVELPLADDFTINIDDYDQPNGGIIFPNPNAPTGVGMGLDAIEALLRINTESVVIVDEAYVDFGGETAAVLVERYPNLLVVQTLSKSRSLAGLRVGFAIGSQELIDGLDRVKNSFNSYPIDRLAEAAAVAALGDNDYFQRCCQRIMVTRQWAAAQLQGLGFEVLPSQANFLFVRPVGIDAAALFAGLREKNILVRYFNKPRIDRFLRITIGTDDEMQALLVAIKQLLA
ncbi:MAG: histidinol-phosphate transaminase [Spongiibacteraceae bacterium]